MAERLDEAVKLLILLSYRAAVLDDTRLNGRDQWRTLKTIIEHGVFAFNKRDIDGALALMAQDVSWPKASEGGKGASEKKRSVPIGLDDGVSSIPHVEPLAMTEEDSTRQGAPTSQEPSREICFFG